MKKIFLILFASVLTISAFSQNVQLHYDMGDGRGYFTSTVEMFKPDKWGSTFFFIDMDYNVGDVEGVSLAYFEIARAINLGNLPFQAHVEYNGGFGQWKAGEFSGAYTINDAWLGGVEKTWANSDFSKGFTLQLLYKNIRGKHDASFQITGVWFVHLLDRKLSLTGFADFWREDNIYGTNETKFTFLTEPQIWYNFTQNFSLGGEVELSNNFGPMEGFNVMPTLGAKWTF